MRFNTDHIMQAVLQVQTESRRPNKTKKIKQHNKNNTKKNKKRKKNSKGKRKMRRKKNKII